MALDGCLGMLNVFVLIVWEQAILVFLAIAAFILVPEYYCANQNWFTTRVHFELHEISIGAAHCVPWICWSVIPEVFF